MAEEKKDVWEGGKRGRKLGVIQEVLGEVGE